MCLINLLRKFNKYDKGTVKEISTNITSNLPKYIQENRKNLLDKIDDFARGKYGIPLNEFRSRVLLPAFILLNSFTDEEQNKILECFSTNVIGVKDLEIDDDNFEQLFGLAKSYLNKRQTSIKDLIKKTCIYIKNGGKISLKTVQFIETLNDDDLNWLKKNIIPFVDIDNGVIMCNYNIACRSTEEWKILNKLEIIEEIFYYEDILSEKAKNQIIKNNTIKIQSCKINFNNHFNIKNFSARKSNIKIDNLSKILDPILLKKEQLALIHENLAQNSRIIHYNKNEIKARYQ